jgi:hypothetical protein
MPEIKVDKFEGAGITDDIVKSAAKLFSENYGIWGTSSRRPNGSEER